MRNRAPVGRRLRRAAPTLLAVALAIAFPASAQQPAPAQPRLAPAPEPVFNIKGFHVVGENPLGPAETGRILAPFVRPDANMSVLQQATTALETALRQKGFGLHRVSLPPQEVGDTVRLEIVSFAINRVDIQGAVIHSDQNVRRTVPELQEGRTPNFKRLAVQTAIANENPNKQVQVGVREGEEPDQIDATITVRESRPWSFMVNASNSGSESTGQDRVTVSGTHTNLFDLDHQFTGAYTTSLARMSDVRQLGLAYKVPLYQLGGVVGVNYTQSDVVGNFGAFTSTGAGYTAGANYTMYLAPEGGRRSYVTVGIEDKLFEATRINDLIVPGALDRRSRPVIVGYNARTESDAAVWGYDVALAANTGSGSGNDLASYQSEDPRVTRVRWKALRGSFHYAAPFAQGWLTSFRAQWQFSPDALISGEQFGLGGSGSVRGTRIERPLSGDKGIGVSLEASTPELLPGLRLFGFLDAGSLWNNNPNATKLPNDRLASVGAGARYIKGPFVGSVEYGRVVLGSKMSPALNAAAPERGDDRVYVNLGIRF